jgi:hypothetical protein
VIGILKTRSIPVTSAVIAAKNAPGAGAVRDGRALALMAWAALAVVLTAGLPIFLSMPVWFDTYHYDICIRTWQRGGVLYRDVFDNNLPGIIWLQAGVRLLVGWRTDAIRLVDLVFFTIDVLLLVRWAPRGSRVWTAVAFYAFYLFVPESCPCERDLWMLLPAIVGLTLRRAQVRRLTLGSPTILSVVGLAALEGLCWAAGVWIKPFVFVPGFACWFVGLLHVLRQRQDRARLLTADAAGLLAGGALGGTLGLLWLWQSGSWPYFWEIFLNWNRDYAAFTNQVRLSHWGIFLITYLPWSAVPVVATCLAITTIKHELVDEPAGSAPAGPGLALLAAFFLGWLFQATCLQLPHDYPIVAALIPGLALIAARWRPRLPSSSLGLTARLCLITLMALIWTLAFQMNRIAYWPQCVANGGTPHMQSLLALHKESAYCTDPESLAPVVEYLRGQGVGDGDVTCMSGCTHPLYLALNLKPSTRFPQVEMTCLFFTKHREEVLAELNASHQRFIVSDLVWTGLTTEEAEETNPADPLALPGEFPDKFALMYPWNEPIVFRSGRYVVQRATGPASRFWREDPVSGSDAKNDYAKTYSTDLSFRDEEAARQSVAVIDDLYRRSEQAGDPAGRHEARIRALTMFDRARAAGKKREADLFWRWLADIKGD